MESQDNNCTRKWSWIGLELNRADLNWLKVGTPTIHKCVDCTWASQQVSRRDSPQLSTVGRANKMKTKVAPGMGI